MQRMVVRCSPRSSQLTNIGNERPVFDVEATNETCRPLQLRRSDSSELSISLWMYRLR